MSIENKIELLWNSANTLQVDFQTHKMLKSYYINTCRKLARNNLQIPKEKFATSHMCPYCGCFWNDSTYGLKLISKQFNNNSKTKKLIEKLEQVKGSTGKVLNKKQKNRAKWLMKKNSHNLAISCYQCKRKSLLKLENPKLKTRQQLVQEKSQTEKETPAFESGKKLLSHHQQKNKNGSNLENNISTPLPSKSKKEISKTKNKKVANNNAPNKVVSKTQKQNSLLQLAALLQKQTKDDKKNSAQKRLESFLK
ncbi:uncharacterized protein LOC135961890 [Calliphora vicina]|uniref:uncharacterized protein LOC135961890 n=1 Tax=Calliphora vicina TaxID=7373 RepID=UPI00325B1322